MQDQSADPHTLPEPTARLPNIERLGILQMNATRVRHAALGHLVASIHGVNMSKMGSLAAVVYWLGAAFVQLPKHNAHRTGPSRVRFQTWVIKLVCVSFTPLKTHFLTSKERE
jgi:hypothetical protein